MSMLDVVKFIIRAKRRIIEEFNNTDAISLFYLSYLYSNVFVFFSARISRNQFVLSLIHSLPGTVVTA